MLFPPTQRPRVGAVGGGQAPVDGPSPFQVLQKHPVQQGEDSGLVPLLEPSPAGHARAAAELGRDVLPADAESKPEEDAGQDLSVGQALAPALGPWRVGRQERGDDLPEVVGKEGGHRERASSGMMRESANRWLRLSNRFVSLGALRRHLLMGFMIFGTALVLGLAAASTIIAILWE